MRNKSVFSLFIMSVAAVCIPFMTSYADGSGDFLINKPTAKVAKKLQVNHLDIDAKAMIEKYRESAMTKCGDNYYFYLTENSPDDSTPFTNDNTVLTVDPGEIIAIVQIRMKSPEKLEGASGKELDDAARLNGYEWVGDAYREDVLLRVYPLKFSYKLMAYSNLIGVDMSGEAIEDALVSPQSQDGAQHKVTPNWLKKWSSWGDVGPIGSNTGYSPWSTVYFFKKSGVWYLGNPNNADASPVSMLSTIETDGKQALKCSEIPK